MEKEKDRGGRVEGQRFDPRARVMGADEKEVLVLSICGKDGPEGDRINAVALKGEGGNYRTTRIKEKKQHKGRAWLGGKKREGSYLDGRVSGEKTRKKVPEKSLQRTPFGRNTKLAESGTKCGEERRTKKWSIRLETSVGREGSRAIHLAYEAFGTHLTLLGCENQEGLGLKEKRVKIVAGSGWDK